MQWVIIVVCAGVIFGTLDALWLRWSGPNLYRPIIGEIMAENFRAAPAAVFYAIYLFGMIWFAIMPGLASGSAATALINGMILGGLCYATYDLTSQAVLKVWATRVSVADIAWGSFVTGVTSGLVALIGLQFAP